MLENDARQHRKGGHRHRRTHEQNGLQRRCFQREEAAVTGQIERQQGAQGEGRQNTGQRDRRGAANAGFDEIKVEFDPDQEHIKHHSDLADGKQNRLGSHREQIGAGVRQQPAQQRRPHEHAANHFTDHLRLAEPLEDEANDPAGSQDDGQLQEEQDGQIEGAHGLGNGIQFASFGIGSAFP